MLQQTCPSLLSEFQFLIRHIQAPFLPPTVHLRDCDGHHNFLADDLWYLFKQCLWAADAVNTVWMDDVYTSSARSCPAEIVGLRSVESNPSCCRAKSTYTLASLTGSRIWQEILPRHPLQSHTDWNGSSIFAALCSVLSCDSHWKWPKQRPWTVEARRAACSPTLDFPAYPHEFPAWA